MKTARWTPHAIRAAALFAAAAAWPAFAQAPEPGGPASEAETAAVPGAAPAAAPPPPAPPPPYKGRVQEAGGPPGGFSLPREEEKVWVAGRPPPVGTPVLFSFNNPPR